jgi:hypothetical protein
MDTVWSKILGTNQSGSEGLYMPTISGIFVGGRAYTSMKPKLFGAGSLRMLVTSWRNCFLDAGYSSDETRRAIITALDHELMLAERSNPVVLECERCGRPLRKERARVTRKNYCNHECQLAAASIGRRGRGKK